ncbi:MAG: RNA methyltransferase [Chloroflexota bacterium]
MINSRQNSKIKQIRAMKQRKHRTASGLFVVEGLHHVGEALEADAKLEYVVYTPELLGNEFGQQLIDNLNNKGIPCYETDAEILTGLSDKDNPQGLLAVAKQTNTMLSNLTAQSSPWIVALVEPQDPGNLGTIMRTIDSVGASALVIIGEGVDIYHPKAVRASMGSLFWHPVIRASFSEFADWASKSKYHVYGSTSNGGEQVQGNLGVAHPSVLLLGSEREGLSAAHLEMCERVFQIPMQGRATSLNLAVAAGVLLYAMQPA